MHFFLFLFLWFTDTTVFCGTFTTTLHHPRPDRIIFPQLGLPPRFAGVSLLALGNGAADVSATVSAITSDPQIGYKLALGALTGAAMLISGGTLYLYCLAHDG